MARGQVEFLNAIEGLNNLVKNIYGIRGRQTLILTDEAEISINDVGSTGLSKAFPGLSEKVKRTVAVARLNQRLRHSYLHEASYHFRSGGYDSIH
ncbi:MAG: hypothetical protein AABM67_16550 [Acidobacteriota bacterium]